MLDLSVNWEAVLLSGIVAVAVGAVWYSPQFLGKAWMKEVRKTEKEFRKHAVREAVSVLVSVFVMASILDVLIKALGATSLFQGLLVGAIAWLGFRGTRHWIAMSFGTSTMKHFLINSAHDLVEFLILGAILGMMG